MAQDHPAAEGHFPGNPIIPGAVLLAEVAAAIGGQCRELRAAKFLRPVRPGERLLIVWEEAGGETRFTASAGDPPVPAVTGTMRLLP
jgi:3-hydroxymyristoyl/3-hydroxydecanoyl-(acyl carrier protein) dehydratase